MSSSRVQALLSESGSGPFLGLSLGECVCVSCAFIVRPGRTGWGWGRWKEQVRRAQGPE